MRTNDFLERGGQFDVAYSSPSVDVFALRAEGILCASYGDPDAPGPELEEGGKWEF